MMMHRWAITTYMFCLFLVFLTEAQPTTVFTITPTTTVVQEITTYSFNLTMTGNLTTRFVIPAGSNIIINFPSAYPSAPTIAADCTLLPSWPVANGPVQCSLTYNSLTITNAFLTDYAPAVNDQLLFVVYPITNPGFVQTINRPPISGVISYNFTNLFSFMPITSISIQSGALGVAISVSPTETDNAFSTLTITVTPAHQIPVGGSLRITMDRYYSNAVFPSSPINQALLCQALFNASDTLSCNYTTSLSSIIVSVFSFNTAPTNSPFTFTLYPFKNPPTTQPFTGITFATNNLVTNGLNIDVSNNNRIRGFTPALALYPTAIFSSKLIGSTTRMNIRLTINNAISPSDTITIITPPEITCTLVDSVIMAGIQGTLTPINSTSVQFTNIQFFSPASPISLIINNLILPSYSASINSPFIMVITRNNNFEVCRMNATFPISLQPGSIGGALNPNNRQAGMLSNYSFVLNLEHSITSSSKITFFFNTQFIISPNLTCTSSASNNCSATSVNNLVTVTSPTIVTTNTLTITLINIVNPSSIGNFIPIIITTYLQVSSVYYLLDSNNIFAFFNVIARPMSFSDLNVSALSYRVYESTTFTFFIRNNNNLPTNSHIWLVFPKQITLNSISCSSTCVAGTYNSSAGVQLQQLGPLPANNVSVFSVRNIITPISTKPTSPFAVYILDQSKNLLEYLDFGTNFQANAPSLLTVSVSAQQLKNSFVGWFNLTYTPRYPIAEAVSLILTVPNSLSCPTCPSNSIDSYSQMKFNDQIMVGGKYFLNLPNFTYFYSTEQISLSAAIMSNDMFFNYANCTFSLTNQFSSSPSFTYSFTTYQRKALADLIISNFTSSTLAQRVSSIKIIIRSDFMYSTANCNNIGYNCTVNDGVFVLTVVNITHLRSFSINNIITPSASPSTFISLYTYSSTGFLIDQSDAIFWQSACSLPCKTCGASVTECTSCYSDIVLSQNRVLYLPINSTCVSYCGDRYYKNYTTNICQACSSSCFNCYNRTFCTSCPTGQYLLPLNNTCYNICPTGYFQKNSQCVACSSDLDCYTCTNELTCQSCFIFYLHQSKCIQKCPQPKTVANSVNFTCDPCPTNCSTCSLVNNTVRCLSCSSGLLDNGACVQSCITYNNAPYGLVCSPCDQSCKTCQGSIFFCTQCNTSSRYPYFLKNKCFQNCPDTYYNDQSTYLCMPCTSPCETCYNFSSNACITCRSPYSRFGTTCNTTCPSQYYVNGPLCSSCVNNCLTCSSANACFTCQQNFTLFAPNSTCLSSCPETYVSVGQVCISCSSNCYNCIAVTLCSSCRNTSFILNYTCYNPCPLGYYSDTSSASCKICVNYCTACTSATYCTRCSSGYYLSNNTCINLCGNSQVSINGICMNCNTNCTACQSSINNCTACASGFLFAPSINACPSSCPFTLYYNPTTQTCVTACPSATYIIKNAQNVSTCIACPSYCSSCVSDSQCGGCVTGTYFFENLCYQNCPSDFPYAFNFKCQSCNVVSCLSCNGSSCVVCQAGLYLIGDTLCITGCSSLQVYNPTNKTCDTIVTNNSNNTSSGTTTISTQESSVVNLSFIPMPFLIIYIIIGIVVFLLHLNSKLSAVPTLLGIIGPLLLIDILVIIFISSFSFNLKTTLLQVVIYTLVAIIILDFMLSFICLRLRYKLTACQKPFILILCMMHHDALALLTANINYYNSFFIQQHKYFWRKYKFICKIGLLLFFPIFFSGVALVFTVANRTNYLFYAGIQLCILAFLQLLLTLAWLWLPMQPVPQKQKSIPSALSQQSTEQVSDAQDESVQNDQEGQQPNEKGSSMEKFRSNSTKKEDAEPEQQIKIRNSQIKSEGDQLQKKSSHSNRAKSNYQFNKINGVVKVQANDIQKALERGLFRRSQQQILKEIKEEEQYSKIDDAQKLNNYLKKQEQTINIFEDYADNDIEQSPISPKVQPFKQQSKEDTVKAVQKPEKKIIIEEHKSKKGSEGSMAMFDEPVLVKQQDFHHNIIFQQNQQENRTYYQGQSESNQQKQLNQPFQLEHTPSLGSIVHRNTDKVKVSQINNSPRLISPEFESNHKQSKVIIQDFDDSFQQSHFNIFNTGNSRIRPKFSKQLSKAEPPKEIIHADFQEIATVSDGGSLQFIEYDDDYEQFDSSRKIVNKRINQNIHDHQDNNHFSRPSDILRQASIHYQPEVQRNSVPKNPAEKPLPRFASKFSRRK